jgi:hypothetical protein
VGPNLYDGTNFEPRIQSPGNGTAVVIGTYDSRFGPLESPIIQYDCR